METGERHTAGLANRTSRPGQAAAHASTASARLSDLIPEADGPHTGLTNIQWDRAAAATGDIPLARQRLASAIEALSDIDAHTQAATALAELSELPHTTPATSTRYENPGTSTREGSR